MNKEVFCLLIPAYILLSVAISGESEYLLKDFHEAILSIVLKTKWMDILIINDYEEVCDLLVLSIHNFGIRTTIIKANHVENYNNFPSRIKLIREHHGYILLTNSEDRIKEISKILKEKRVINSRKQWVFISKYMSKTIMKDLPLKEGDNVLLLGKSPLGLPEEDQELYCPEQWNTTEVSEESLNIFSLYSIGNGYYAFCYKGFWSKERGLQSKGDFFYSPFQNFRNRTLNAVSLGEYPVRIAPKVKGERWKGCMFEAVNTLADCFNFSYEVYDPEESAYGVPKSGTQNWTGLIGELVNNNADLGVADLSWSPDRSQAVDFTYYLFDETLTFAYRAPSFLTRAWILFKPYNIEVWLALGCTGMFVAMSLVTVTVLDVYLFHKKTICLNKMIYQAIENCYRIMMTQGSNTHSTVSTGRIVTGTWLLSMLIFVAIYSGNLTYSLTFHTTDRPVDSLKEMVAKYPHVKLTVRNGSLPCAYFMENNSTYHGVWKNNMEKNVVPGNTSGQEIMALVRKLDYVWIYERTILEKQMKEASTDNTICEFYVAKEDILYTNWALALQKDSPFLFQFNERIKWMTYYGLTRRWKNHYWTMRQHSCQPTDGLNQLELKAVSLEDTEAIFLFLVSGLLLSFVVAIVELIIFRWRNSNSRKACYKLCKKKPIKKLSEVIKK